MRCVVCAFMALESGSIVNFYAPSAGNQVVPEILTFADLLLRRVWQNLQLAFYRIAGQYRSSNGTDVNQWFAQ